MILQVCVWTVVRGNHYVYHTGAIARIAAKDHGDVAKYVRQYPVDMHCILSHDPCDDLGILHGVNILRRVWWWSRSPPVPALHCG